MLISKSILQRFDQLSPISLFAYTSIFQVFINEIYRIGLNQNFEQLLDSDTALKYVIFRQVISVPAWVCINYSAKVLPIGLTQLFQNIIPILVAFMSCLFLKEYCLPHEAYCFAAAFLATLLVSITRLLDNTDSPVHQDVFWGIMAATYTSIAFACINIIGRKLKDYHHAILGSAQAQFNLLLGWILYIFYIIQQGPRLFVIPNLEQAAVISLLAIFRFISTATFIKACQIEKAHRVAFLNYLQAPFGYLLDYLLYDYGLIWSEYIATCIVLGASVFLFKKCLYYRNDV